MNAKCFTSWEEPLELALGLLRLKRASLYVHEGGMSLKESTLAGTCVDGEALEKGGRMKLEPARSVVTIGRCEMTIRLLRQQPATGHDRRGELTSAHLLLERIKLLALRFSGASGSVCLFQDAPVQHLP